jgi:hypothetical protein
MADNAPSDRNNPVRRQSSSAARVPAHLDGYYAQVDLACQRGWLMDLRASGAVEAAQPAVASRYGVQFT